MKANFKAVKSNNSLEFYYVEGNEMKYLLSSRYNKTVYETFKNGVSIWQLTDYRQRDKQTNAVRERLMRQYRRDVKGVISMAA